MKKIVFSGMRPTGKLHLGHLVGALSSWIKLQEEYSCIFSIADWHALMGEYENSKTISNNIMEMAFDWLSCSIDPKKSIIFIQSHVPEHLELQMIFSCITPLGWLERNPTYKEQLREITTRNVQTYGFLGYPVLQAADILLYKATSVPIGEDQLPHLELTREIARRFNFIFKNDYFKDCEPILTKVPRLFGLDGRKMSKSYNNTINLSDPEETVRTKIRNMVTDPTRIKLTDPGHPDQCSVFSYYEVFACEKVEEVKEWCVNSKKGCRECKDKFADCLMKILGPIQEKRKEFEKNPDMVTDILNDGKNKASTIARKTMQEVRDIIF